MELRCFAQFMKKVLSIHLNDVPESRGDTSRNGVIIKGGMEKGHNQVAN